MRLWLNNIPEAFIDEAHMALYLNRVAQINERRALINSLNRVNSWLFWYVTTDFRGRYPTNQYLFAKSAKVILQRNLKRWGPVRKYVKSKD